MSFVLRTLKNLAKKLPIAAELYALALLRRNLKQQLSIWSDYFQTKKQTRFLRNSNSTPTKKKTALIASMSDFIYQIKLEALLGVGLQKQNWEVIVLSTSPINFWAKLYFKAFGINKFIFWDELQISEAEEKRCDQLASKFLSENLSFKK
jgi:hypothetical protein